MKKVFLPTDKRRPYPLNSSENFYPISNTRHVASSNPQRSPNFPTNHYRDRPPGPETTPFHRSNFVVKLIAGPRGFQKVDIEALIDKCKPTMEYSRVFVSGLVAGELFFKQWVDALEAMVRIWELRLDGTHNLTMSLKSKVVLPSDMDDLNDRLRNLFGKRVKCLIEGEEVQKWQKECRRLSDEIVRVSRTLRTPKDPGVFYELRDKKKGLDSERDLIGKRISEFKSAMNCILGHLEGKMSEECDKEGVDVIKFNNGDFNWSQIHNLILRECRRLEDGLPLYAYRREILQQVHIQQIMVLIGETGSGKSTQLVQFLADSRIVASDSIVCTQPRKIAAISLAQRVREESSGCYKDDFVTCYPTFSSAQQFNSKVVYMTDHCLLQHYMNDKNMSGISCIIIDEAHERSLNTDLLLALIKCLLCQRLDLRLIIMSATANANQLSDYFFACGIFHVLGRNFPVDLRYVPRSTEGTSAPSIVASYVFDVVRMACEIHKMEKEGAILAFLTSQMEVEWACEKFEAPGAVPLALHGKLSFEEQFRVFLNYPGRRKVIFATNIAETSLTIPGVKYVIDSGLAKDSCFEPGTGMNVLRVGRISKSSANQRAGRAGRTEPGRCYRLYSESDFQSMPLNQEPEIRRVHLGIAVLRILALGIKNVEDFDFVDAPSSEAIDMAIRNLVQLGAVKQSNAGYELTDEGCYLVKMGIEPRLGKLILSCFHHRLGREGLVLAAVMANGSSIFCRVGNNEDKLKSDCLKVQFCHSDGDLFTLLSVYKEWEALPRDRKNKWCWENSINAKTMRRCQDTVMELEQCLRQELNVIIPSYWLWNSDKATCHDKYLKNAILASLVENVAMFSGYDKLGYEVALTGQMVQLHPSCSLLIFSQKPNWVVFGELLSVSNEYMVCVTAFDFESLSSLNPPLLFNVSDMETRRLQMKVVTGSGCTLLKRFCGKANSNLLSLVSRIRKDWADERIGIEVNVDHNEIFLYAPSQKMENVFNSVHEVLEYERKWLRNECMEKSLYLGAGGLPSIALFGAGADIKYMELEKRFLTVDVFHSNTDAFDEKELLMFLEKIASGSICSIHKFTGSGQDGDDKEQGLRVTFLTPEAAEKASKLKQVYFKESLVKVIPSLATSGVDHKLFSIPAVKARVSWPRRLSKGFAIVKCDTLDVGHMIEDLSNLLIGGKYVHCGPSTKNMDSVVLRGVNKELSESEILDVLRTATRRKILDFFLVRGNSVGNPPINACEESLLKEIYPFMPTQNRNVNSCRVQVFPPEMKDSFMRASITFDGRLHLEAAKALEHLEGKVLPGFFSWQKIKCQQLFHSSISCSVPVYHVIKELLDSLLASFGSIKGAECNLVRNANGSYRVKISANATKIVAELRQPVEELMRGKAIDNASLTPTILQHLITRDGLFLMRSLQKETDTHIYFDRHKFIVRVTGSPEKIAIAKEKLVQSLLTLHESKQLEIHLRGGTRPPDLMKQVVKNFGPDLNGLKEKLPDSEFTLNTRHHVINIHGNKELKQKVEEIIYEIAQSSNDGLTERLDNEAACAICLCGVEDGYQLEGCGHVFCRLCLVEQFESVIKNQGNFPICCTNQACRSPILLTDLRSLLSGEKLEELFRASMGAFVLSSGGTYRFCPTPDCPSIYRVAKPGSAGDPFVCGSCFTETCTGCHLEYHPYFSCEKYKEFKEDPDSSLKEWRKDKEERVKNCPVCGYTIEKVEGCNHVECKCGRHICWVCLEFFGSADDCYGHLRIIHLAIG